MTLLNENNGEKAAQLSKELREDHLLGGCLSRNIVLPVPVHDWNYMQHSHTLLETIRVISTDDITLIFKSIIVIMKISIKINRIISSFASNRFFNNLPSLNFSTKIFSIVR